MEKKHVKSAYDLKIEMTQRFLNEAEKLYDLPTVDPEHWACFLDTVADIIDDSFDIGFSLGGGS